MLISVHIPKTGGSSFRTLLKNHFSNKLLLDYGDTPFNHHSFIRNTITITKMWSARSVEQRCDCIHGHFLPIKYILLKEKTFTVWLREPVEMVVSLYYYIQRNAETQQRKINRYMGDVNISLEDFCKIGHFHNIYAKYLWGMSLEQFSFVGITENYAHSIEIFKKQHNIPSEGNLIVENVNPNKSTPIETYEVTHKLRQQICNFNYKDIEIYRKALEINERLEQRYL